MVADLRALGIERGDTLLVHCSLSLLGWVPGGPPGVERSIHPTYSFAAWGVDAESVVSDYPLDYGLGGWSPLARVYERDGRVLFLGTTHATNTSLHLAEYRGDLPGGTRTRGGPLLDFDVEWVEANRTAE
jgi:aminoglycoside 3-N-acetyltransferase